VSNKYVSKKGEGIANCPVCRGVLFRDLKIDKENCRISLMMRCPHCQKNIPLKLDIVEGAVICKTTEETPSAEK